jgi:hypothetical protein
MSSAWTGDVTDKHPVVFLPVQTCEHCHSLVAAYKHSCCIVHAIMLLSHKSVNNLRSLLCMLDITFPGSLKHRSYQTQHDSNRTHSRKQNPMNTSKNTAFQQFPDLQANCIQHRVQLSIPFHDWHTEQSSSVCSHMSTNIRKSNEVPFHRQGELRTRQHSCILPFH